MEALLLRSAKEVRIYFDPKEAMVALNILIVK